MDFQKWKFSNVLQISQVHCIVSVSLQSGRKKVEYLFMAIKIFHAAFHSPCSVLVHQRANQCITQECSGMFTSTAGQNLENCDPCVQLVMLFHCFISISRKIDIDHLD